MTPKERAALECVLQGLVARHGLKSIPLTDITLNSTGADPWIQDSGRLPGNASRAPKAAR
jgi:hypothetical protein